MDKDEELAALRKENTELKTALAQALETIAKVTTRARVQEFEHHVSKDSQDSHLTLPRYGILAAKTVTLWKEYLCRPL